MENGLSLLLLVLLVVMRLGAQQQGDLDRISNQARQALAAKKWDEAITALRSLSQLAPDVPEVFANLGLAYFFKGRPAEALGAFQHAQKLNAALLQIEPMIGLCDAELGRYRSAVTILASAFDHPPDPDTGRLIGLHLQQSYVQLQEFDKAIFTGEELVRRYPNDPEVLFQASRLHADRSYELMSELIRAAPDSAWTHYANAQVQESLDRFDVAAQEYRNALQRDPHLPAAHYRLGRVILRISTAPASREEAKHEFEKELAISPTNSDAEYELGETEREGGRLEAASSHFERALQYHPEFVEANVAMAKTLLALNRAGDALSHLQKAVRLDPGNRMVHYLLASVYKSLGDGQGAAREIALYRKLGARDSSATSRKSGISTIP
jgi:tetratricopeptide (TPR) repeat protein